MHEPRLVRFTYTDKKENKIFLEYKEIGSENVAKSYVRKGFLINEEMRTYFHIYEEAVSHIHSKDKIPKFRNKYSQKRNIGVSIPNFHIHASVSFIYFHHLSAYSAGGNM